MSSAWLLLVLILGFVAQSWASLEVLEDEMSLLKAAFYRQTYETNERVKTLQKEVDDLKRENLNKDQVIGDLQRTLNDIIETRENTSYYMYIELHIVKEQPRTSETTVALHTCFTNDVHYLGRNQILLFNKVVTDTQYKYTQSTGTYSIPFTGYYVITWVTPAVVNIPLKQVVNGEPRGRTDPSSTGNGASQSTTGLAVFILYENDNVSIRTHTDATPTGAIVNNKWQDSCFSLW